ncbi:hypothetical protein [Micromonospora sp. NPDC047527]|uniref:hypothetical protein n=1 Tax=Micromonospora sp. NPDC047527 TaxID=3155144 RepID=UPI0033CA93DF
MFESRSAPASSRPIESKVKAATVGAGGSAAIITPAVLWVVDELWFNGRPRRTCRCRSSASLAWS